MQNSTNIVITGGAGGIAAATSRMLVAKPQMRVALLDIDGDGLQRAVSALGETQATFELYVVDLTDPDVVVEAINEFCADKKLDVLFANVGISTGGDVFEKTSIADINRSIDVNFRSVAISVSSAWSALAAAKGQVIINASGAGKTPIPNDPTYSAAKAAAIMFARAQALRTGETGIRFNAICPGVVDTNILQDSRTGKWRPELHEFVKHFDLLHPDEIASAVVELISDNSRNGETIQIYNRPKRQGA